MYLKCEAALYVYVSIKIQKGNKLLTAKLSVNSKTTVLEYEILSANKADAGLYKCFATLKRGGEKIKEYYVTVKGNELTSHWFSKVYIFLNFM